MCCRTSPRLDNTGVYVFFAISGFIMVHICWGSFGQRGAAAELPRRRVIRIVPLYWLARDDGPVQPMKSRNSVFASSVL
jgi:hypothetical protein